MIKILDESNVFDLMRRQFDETTINRFLAGLFRENKRLLKAFLRAGGVPSNVTWYDVAEEEYCPASGTRIDILITTSDKYICVENKIDSNVHSSGNGVSQLKNYVDYVEQIAEEDGKEAYFILLYPQKNLKVGQLEDTYNFGKVSYEDFIPMLKQSADPDDRNVLDFIENMEKNVFVRESDSTFRLDVLTEALDDLCGQRRMSYRPFDRSGLSGFQIFYQNTNPYDLSFVIVPQRDYMDSREPKNNRCNINVADKLAFFVFTNNENNSKLKRRLLSNGITSAQIHQGEEKRQERSIYSSVDHFFRFIDIYGDDLKDDFCSGQEIIDKRKKDNEIMDIAEHISNEEGNYKKARYVSVNIPKGVYHNKKKTAYASVDEEGNWTILAGSWAEQVASSYYAGNKAMLNNRDKVVKNGKFVEDVNLGNVSPSTAADYIRLKSTNGWDFWFTEDDIPIKEAFPRKNK